MLCTYLRHVVYAAARGLALLNVVVCALLLSGCSQANYQFNTVKIGLVAPLSGENFSEGYRWLYAARQAIADWNAAASSKPYRIELVAYDETEGAAVARRLTLDPDVLGVVGHWDPAIALEAESEYRKVGLPLLAVGIADPALTAESPPQVFRLTPPAGALGRGVGVFLAQQLHPSAVAVVAGPALSDLAMGDALRQGATAADLRVARVEAVQQYSTDYRGVLERLEVVAPQAVLYSGAAAEAQSFLGQYLRYQGWRQPPPVILAPNAGSPDVLREAPRPSHNVYWISGGGDPRATKAGTAFWAAYQRRWNQSPSPLAAVVYDGTNLLLQGIESALASPTTDHRQQVSTFLRQGVLYRGVAREYSFDGRGKLVNPRAYVYRLDGGSFPGDLAAEIGIEASADQSGPLRR